MVQLPWSDLLTNQIYTTFGPSLVVNRKWIKRNDHAPKSECAGLFDMFPKKAVWRN